MHMFTLNIAIVRPYSRESIAVLIGEVGFRVNARDKDVQNVGTTTIQYTVLMLQGGRAESVRLSAHIAAKDLYHCSLTSWRSISTGRVILNAIPIMFTCIPPLRYHGASCS